MKNAAVVFCLTVLGLGLGPLAWGHMDGQGTEPCQMDLEKFCKDVQPGGGRLMQCLKAHQSELASACGQVFAEKMKQEQDKGPWPCEADVEKFCKDVQPGEGRQIRCLQGHESELSGGCRQLMTEKSKEKPWPCQADAEKFCKGVQPGGGRINACLKQHESELSQECRKMCGDKMNSDKKICPPGESK